jgi:hypothetical protein
MACLFQEPYYDCKGVIHSLPIQKIVEDKFEPRYTAYIMTYYSPAEKVENNLNIFRNYNGDAFFAPPNDDEPDPESWWDLKRWVKEDKLYWMDSKEKEFNFVKGNVDNFPFGDIKGIELIPFGLKCLLILMELLKVYLKKLNLIQFNRKDHRIYFGQDILLNMYF